MCRATLGAMPVYLWTCAASAIFSYGSRGTPGWAKTLNRVPELPKAQDGSSMCCRARTGVTAVRSTMSEPASLFSTRDSAGGQRHVDQLDTEQVRGRLQFGTEISDAERPVVRDAGRAPRVDPFTGVAAEVDPGGRVADLQHRAGHDGPGGRDEPVDAVALLGDAEGGHRPVPDIE